MLRVVMGPEIAEKAVNGSLACSHSSISPTHYVVVKAGSRCPHFRSLGNASKININCIDIAGFWEMQK